MSLLPKICSFDCPNKKRLDEAFKEIELLQNIIKAMNSKTKCFVKDPDGHPEYDCHNHHKWPLI